MAKIYSFIDHCNHSDVVVESSSDKLQITYLINQISQVCIYQYGENNENSENKDIIKEHLRKFFSNDNRQYIMYSVLIDDIISGKKIDWIDSSPNWSEWKDGKFITNNRSFDLPDNDFDPKTELNLKNGKVISLEVEYMLSRFRGDRCL